MTVPVRENGAADRLLKAEEVAERWQVPTAHVYRLARGEQIPTVKIGRYRRFRLAAVEQFERDGGAAHA